LRIYEREVRCVVGCGEAEREARALSRCTDAKLVHLFAQI
jgi:hypothetical protein